MQHTTIHDCRIIDIRKYTDNRGYLSVIEGGIDIPFEIKRIYYLYMVPEAARGAHAHKTLRELIIAASGSFEVRVFDGKREKTILLNHPSQALYLPCGVWEELKNFSSGSIALVLASTPYNPDDYYRDFEELLQHKKEL